MSARWIVELEAWPYNSVPQAYAGPREQLHFVNARDVREALTAAEQIAKGVLMNPAVWQAPIIGVRHFPIGDGSIHQTERPSPERLEFPTRPNPPVQP